MPANTERVGGTDILTVGFGTTVAMWSVGYFCRLFGAAVPAPLLFVLLMICLLAGGLVAGRYSGRGIRTGLYGGLVAGLLNLLIVGSLISGQRPNQIRASAPLWAMGTLVVCTILSGIGAAVGRSARRPADRKPDWPGLFGMVAGCATFVLLAAGGLVTGFEEGLAVPDWPNTEGYSMFLYPLSRMTGGIYLEHAHRLFGSLVGLTVGALAVQSLVTDHRHWLKSLAVLLVLAVVAQGILGGLRVTGHFTLSTSAAQTRPSILLAVIHGVCGQVVFAVVVALAIFRSHGWREGPPPAVSPAASTDRSLGSLLVVFLIGQIALGALVRHLTWGLPQSRDALQVDPVQLIALGNRALTVHIAVAVLTTLLAVTVGVRAWGLYPGVQPLARLGGSLLVLIAAQIALGVAALVTAGFQAPHRAPQPLDVAITTLHQIVGAALLAWAVMLVLWSHRLLVQDRAADSQAPAPAFRESAGDHVMRR